MLVSQLPMMVDMDFELCLKVPGPGDDVQVIDLTARCLWSHEDINPRHYDSGFRVVQASLEYQSLINALLHYFSFDPLQASA